MRRRFNRSRFGRASFRRRRAVAWQTNGPQHQPGGEVLLTSGDVSYFLLQHPDNDFVENHPRFAKANDTLTLRRILGQLRVAMYPSAESDNFNGFVTDTPVHYGIVILKGDYDAAGVWTQKDTPDPAEPSDEDDEWLFKNTVWLSPGSSRTLQKFMTVHGTAPGAWVSTSEGGAADGPLVVQPVRQAMLSTDSQLPNGSFIDLKTRRKLEYGERLAIAAKIDDIVEEFYFSIYVSWQLRMLAAKWS